MVRVRQHPCLLAQMEIEERERKASPAAIARVRVRASGRCDGQVLCRQELKGLQIKVVVSSERVLGFRPRNQ
jgi:hypothetical protein